MITRVNCIKGTAEKWKLQSHKKPSLHKTVFSKLYKFIIYGYEINHLMQHFNPLFPGAGDQLS
jgi:hypothetical protein